MGPLPDARVQVLECESQGRTVPCLSTILQQARADFDGVLHQGVMEHMEKQIAAHHRFF